MEEKQYKIYRLILDNKVVYVGQTTQKYLNQRKACHNYNNTFERIIESIIELIEITSDKTRERYWIEYYLSEGCILFNKRKGVTGLNYEEYQKEYKEENKEKIKEYKKEYQQENKEKIKENKKEYYQKNKDKIKEYQKQYQKNKLKNKEDVKN